MEENRQTGMREEKILEIKDLCMEFPSGRKQTVKALNHVTFDIYKGENFGLVGESGSYMLNRVYDLGVNSARTYYTKYARFDGRVIGIL